MAETKDLFSRLKKLFSTDVIIRNVGGKALRVVDTDQIEYATDRNSLRDRFNRLRSSSYNLHNRDMSLSYQAARLELFRDYDCVGADTVIPLPDGSRPTIKELTEKYKDRPQERFYVWSYDLKTNSMKLGKAYHPRKKEGTRIGFKVTFDNGQFVIGSVKHPFLMRNGEYKKIVDLKVGDSVMPFYQKEYGYDKHGFKRYRKVYNFDKGWQSEHKIIAEQFNGEMKKNEVVHHKNFKGSDNSPDNLQIMDWYEHQKFHAEHNRTVLWGEENYEIQLNKLKSHPNYINRKIHIWNGERAGENNPFYGKQHTEESNVKRSVSLKEALKDVDRSGENNPNHRDDLTIETLKSKASEYYKNNGKLMAWGLVEFIGCDYSVLQNRLESNNTDWKSFKNEVESTLNHTIISIDCMGPLDVYDVTVEEYHNFATDSCIVSNTMDLDPILSAALDIYSDNVCVPSEFGKILTISSNNESIKKVLENLFYDILNVEFNLWSWVRNLTKYGDMFLKLELSPEYGIYVVRPLSAYEVTRVEGSDPKNINYVKFQHDGLGGGAEYENFEMAHFRLISDSNFLPYGKSMLEGARRVWKQLSLLEDAMLIHRIVRAPEKRIFKIDVGNIPPNEIDAFMQKIMDGMKKVPYIDERTGDYNLRYNLNNMLEDFYLPVRGGDSGTSIDTLPGMEFTGIDDLEYVKNKMMAALKIPKAFLGFDEAVGGKGTLAAEDVRFSHTITRIQRIIVSELTKIAVVHLYIQGYKDASLVDFELKMSNPSTVFEQEKLAIWQDKVNLAKDMFESKLFSSEWIYKNVWNMSKDDIEILKDQVIKDQKEVWRIAQIEEAGNDPAKSKQSVDADGKAQEHSGGGEPPAPSGADDSGLPDLPDLPDLKENVDPNETNIEKVANEMVEIEKKEKHLSELSELKLKEIEEKALQEERDRDQTGNKEKYQDTTTKLRGEDPLGKLVAREKTTSHPLKHNFRGGSPLSLDEIKSNAMSRNSPASLDEELKRLKLALSAKFGLIGSKKVLAEGPISMLDEINLK